MAMLECNFSKRKREMKKVVWNNMVFNSAIRLGLFLELATPRNVYSHIRKKTAVKGHIITYFTGEENVCVRNTF